MSSEIKFSESEFSAADVVSKFFTNLEADQLENGNKILKYWRIVVESIYGNGKKLAAHSKVVDLKNGILLIETDHPGWSQLLHTSQNYILKGLKRYIPNVEIRSLAFRLRGSSASLTKVDESSVQENERNKLQKKFDEEDRYLEEFEKKRQNSVSADENQDSKVDLPDNLKNLFARFKDDMLTKNK